MDTAASPFADVPLSKNRRGAESTHYRNRSLIL
jgi:hypothetical protein